AEISPTVFEVSVELTERILPALWSSIIGAFHAARDCPFRTPVSLADSRIKDLLSGIHDFRSKERLGRSLDCLELSLCIIQDELDGRHRRRRLMWLTLKFRIIEGVPHI